MIEKGLFIVNAFWTNASMARMTEMFLRAASDQSIALSVVTNAALLADIQRGRAPEAAFALLWDKDIRLGQLLEAGGMPVFNSAAAIADCDDKTLTYLRLRDRDIPMPRTLLCPQTFPGCGYGEAAFVDEYAETLSCPFVVKEGCGSFGQQVYLAHSADEARDILKKAGAVPVLFQKFIRESAGRDIRLYMVGGDCVAAMERVNLSGDFRANIAGGGTARRYTPSPEEISLAARACEHLGLSFAGVDLLHADEGALLCEVNSNAHFSALAALTGADPAAAILSYIRRKLCSAT